jgi:glutamine synthetase
MSLVHVDYIWVDGLSQPRLRGKTKMVQLNELEDGNFELPLEEWNFDGSSTGQAPTSDSERLLVPSRMYQFSDSHYVVLCEVRYPDDDKTPHETCFRAIIREQLEGAKENPKLWLGFEQEYFITKENRNILWPVAGEPIKDDRYYCGTDGDTVKYRRVVREHASFCNKIGIEIVGYNAEVAPGQWEYQCFSKDTLKACDDLWASRYIMSLLCEEEGLGINWSPKPHEGWNGSGCHTNFSTDAMRSGEGGKGLFDNILARMKDDHAKTIEEYGAGNRSRLVGKYETANYNSFSWGVGSRGTSVRIPGAVVQDGWKGYLEDRRPASCCDPYRVVIQLLKFV